jgi:hypothetical protein
MKKPVKLKLQSDDLSDELLAIGQRTTLPTSEPEVEERLMTLHHCALRVRGVLHLLNEALQSNGGIDRKNVDAICALVASSEKDLHTMDTAISALVDHHLAKLRS